jgi:lipoprotein-anchoring transpeptidase ErfK/SrfK
LRKFLIPPVMRTGHVKYKHTNPIENTKEMAKGTGEFFKKNYNLKEPIFKKDPAGRNINNLYTGYGYGGKGRAIATVSLLGGGTLVASNPKGYQGLYNGDFVDEQSAELDVESLQSTRGDAQGYQTPLGESASEMMRSSGDLVFAMHKTRHSGQM